MIRVVLDTNVIVSALLNPRGLPAQILLMVMSESVRLCVSADIYLEYEDVIRRPHFRRSETVVGSMLSEIRNRGVWVSPVEVVKACSDPDDNMFLECAVTAKAEYLVTGNLRHFPSLWNNTRIVSPRSFVDALRT